MISPFTKSGSEIAKMLKIRLHIRIPEWGWTFHLMWNVQATQIQNVSLSHWFLTCFIRMSKTSCGLVSSKSPSCSNAVGGWTGFAPELMGFLITWEQLKLNIYDLSHLRKEYRYVVHVEGLPIGAGLSQEKPGVGMVQGWSVIKYHMYRMVQLNFTPEIEVFYRLFERSLSILSITSLKQLMEYFNFRSIIQFDHPVFLPRWNWVISSVKLFPQGRIANCQLKSPNLVCVRLWLTDLRAVMSCRGTRLRAASMTKESCDPDSQCGSGISSMFCTLTTQSDSDDLDELATAILSKTFDYAS